MKFAWVLIFLTTIASAMAGDMPDKDNPLLGHKGCIVRVETVKHDDSFEIGTDIHINPEPNKPKPFLTDHIDTGSFQPNFFDHLVDYTEKAINTGVACIPHAFRLTLGICCLFSENRDLRYALMRASGVAWFLYYLKIGMDNDYVHNDEDGPPFMQSVYRTSFIYSGLSYFTYFPYFTHFGALHITHNICLYGYKILTKPKTTKQSTTTKTRTKKPEQKKPEEVHKK